MALSFFRGLVAIFMINSTLMFIGCYTYNDYQTKRKCRRFEIRTVKHKTEAINFTSEWNLKQKASQKQRACFHNFFHCFNYMYVFCSMQPTLRILFLFSAIQAFYVVMKYLAASLLYLAKVDFFDIHIPNLIIEKILTLFPARIFK